MADHLLFHALLLGIGATFLMDIATLGQKHLLGLQSLDYAMVGRWLGHLLHGSVIHRPIAASPPVPAERLAGWVAHYVIGIAFGLIFLLIVGRGWIAEPRLIPALAFGAVTVLAPFLILQPCLGVGLAARKAPQPNLARIKSVLTHLIFGFGLWLSAVCVSQF